MLVASAMSIGPFFKAVFWPPNAVLHPGHPWNFESIYQTIQAGCYRQHVCYAQRGRRTRILQFHRRAEQSMGLVS